MNDVPSPDNPDQPPPPPEAAQVRLTADSYETFMEDVDLLYIPSNTSGRIRFLQEWPAAAKYLFGEELMKFDQDGVADMEERKRRAALEVDAEARRLDLLEILQDIESKIIVKGETQISFIKETIELTGQEVSALFLSPAIMQKFGGALPPLPEDLPESPLSEEALSETEAPVEPPSAAVEPPPTLPPAAPEPAVSHPVEEPVIESAEEATKEEEPESMSAQIEKKKPELTAKDFDELLSRVPKKKQIKRKTKKS